MLVILRKDCTAEQATAVEAVVRQMGYQPQPVPGADRTAICITGNKGPVDPSLLAHLPGVLECIAVTRPYKMVSREVHPADTVITVGDVQIGGAEPVLIAGPCSVETEARTLSVVYASIFGAVMASIPALKTHMVVFDTAVVDLTADLQDPVDLLFGAQLGGGTDINQALGYCQQLVSRPQETILVLISDLYEGGNRDQLMTRAAQLVKSGVQTVTLLALDDNGAPSYDRHIAAEYAALRIPAFACTPDLFPDLMAAAINQQDMTFWAAQHDIKLPRPLEA